MQHYSRAHYRAVSPASDTPHEIAVRRRRNAVLEQVHREREEKFPVITAANFGEANLWQERRIAELLTERS